MKTIGFVSKEDPFHDRVAWSGTIYKLREAIELAGFEVRWIPYGSSIRSRFWDYFVRGWNRVFTKYKWIPRFYFRPLAKAWAKELDANKSLEGCDYLFFPLGAPIALYSKVEKPFIYLSGYTVPLMFDYYWFDIKKWSKRMARVLDEAAARKALVNIRSSQWAYDSLVNDYHVAKSKGHVLLFGPNLDAKDIRKGPRYDGGQLQILFSGVDWPRKGGDISVEAVELLRAKGVDAILTVAGQRECPKVCVGKDYVEFVGYLNKNKPEDYQKYLSLYEQSHLFLLPTKAECGAIVYSEAAAAGLPCYTYLTGGSGDYVVNGLNGRTLPLGSTANEFAEQILKDIQEGNLAKFREGALRLYKEKLSWEAWAKGFAEIMRDV